MRISKKTLQIIGGTLATICAVCLILQTHQPAQNTEDCSDKTISVNWFATDHDQAQIYTELYRTTEATISLTVTGNHIKCIPASPILAQLSKTPSNIVRIENTDPRQKMDFHYSYMWHIGLPGAAPNLGFVYSLPFEHRKSFRVNQSYFGHSHTVNTGQQFAVDFGLPQGTNVCAARAGTVVAFRQDSHMNGSTASFDNCANYVTIKHDDGTYAEYAHLRTNGVLVHLHDAVSQNTVIGISGNTGHTDGPHLHFMVYTITDLNKRQSIPISFATNEGIKSQLAVGHSYANVTTAEHAKVERQ